MKHIEVVAGIIENENKILCMQRDKGKYNYVSYKWEFPGGKIEDGETKEQALKRELEEEMEMEVEIIKHFCDINYSYPDFDMNMYCFICKTASRDLKMNVHKDFKWLPVSEIAELDWAPADRPVVQKLTKEK